MTPFAIFHRSNPHIYAKIVELARAAKRKGKRVGMRLLIEVVRWDVMMETDSSDEFKINNNFAPEYARMMDDDPEFAGYFKLRGRHGEQRELLEVT